ncbi:hypothetical protein M2475_000131 [Breznakia sp. PF5-3]|uniref:SGNH/GDSL hydrolase family protein n=1 Tax=unclassified Breznakia TaxID=2623764 RepID=UPI002404F16A|nr:MULTISPECIES: SGNH/GDSL hydrolase family protein [unclassified Breznakia]MDF9823852.1 hypothetical protein [Breznakia sp. PM6-1]MDF9834582.1 hypothetical protein [Breznakia sp. PF5-3]MDF9836801.1 hypothetical protein [Breznakia sp. PFB2-8]MDF9858750.1 hypothetical protein [Breznakia sp. PH5-24]
MEYKDLDLHGVHDLVDIRGRMIMSRYPQRINTSINHEVAYQMIGGEIRLYPLSDCCITIGSLFCWTQAKCLVFYGDYAAPEEIIFNKEVSIHVGPQKVFRTQTIQIPSVLHKPHRFHNQVIRIVLLGEGLYVKHIFGKYRLPLPEEIPTQKMLVYGSSISQGCNATSPDLSYASILSRRLGFDLYNYALSGHAFCEREVCDFLVSSNTYQIIVYELSVNMLTNGYSVEEFKERVTYLLKQTLLNQPEANIYCVGILPFYGDYGIMKEGEELLNTADEYRMAYRDLVTSFASPRLFYIGDQDLLRVENLSSDLLHPSNYGMIEIADNIYRCIKDKNSFSK